MEWSAFNKFDGVNDRYLPLRGEGDTKATQVCTAVNKLVYKWYNDGDVYDNVNSPMAGWCNDLSSYANWLAKYAGAGDILEQVFECYGDEEYESILWELANALLDEELLEGLDKEPAVGSIYDCEGVFEFSEGSDEDDDGWY